MYNFRYPILVTLVHMALKAPFAKLAMLMFGIPPIRFTSVRQYLTVVVPVGVATSLDVVLSNASLQFITVTVYTIIKSSVPAWILCFSFALGLTKPSCLLVVIIVVISSGISLASLDGNMRAAWGGAALCAGASVCAGVRWALSQLVLQPHGAAAHPSAGQDAEHDSSAARGAEGAPAFTWEEFPTERQPASRRGSNPFAFAATGAADDRRARPSGEARPLSEGYGEGAPRNEVEGLLPPTHARPAPLAPVAPVDGIGQRSSPLALARGRAAAAAGGAAAPQLTQSAAKAGVVVDPIAFLLYMSPWAALTLVPAALANELGPLLSSTFVRDRAAFREVVLLSAVGALIAFFLLLAELLLVRATSGLTLSVAGIFKEVLTICASILVLGDELSPINAAGLTITLLGVGIYNVLMVRQQLAKARGDGGSSRARSSSRRDRGANKNGARGDDERDALELAGEESEPADALDLQPSSLLDRSSLGDGSEEEQRGSKALFRGPAS